MLSVEKCRIGVNACQILRASACARSAVPAFTKLWQEPLPDGLLSEASGHV